jgi:putative intracellular protease/amidase
MIFRVSSELASGGVVTSHCEGPAVLVAAAVTVTVDVTICYSGQCQSRWAAFRQAGSRLSVARAGCRSGPLPTRIDGHGCRTGEHDD